MLPWFLAHGVISVVAHYGQQRSERSLGKVSQMPGKHTSLASPHSPIPLMTPPSRKVSCALQDVRAFVKVEPRFQFDESLDFPSLWSTTVQPFTSIPSLVIFVAPLSLHSVGDVEPTRWEQLKFTTQLDGSCFLRSNISCLFASLNNSTAGLKSQRSKF